MSVVSIDEPLLAFLVMILSAPESIFSIPFRFLWSTNFAGELEALEQRPTGLARFVGDETNQRLKIFVSNHQAPSSFRHLDGLWPLVFYGASGTGKTSLALTILAELTNADQFDEADQELNHLTPESDSLPKLSSKPVPALVRQSLTKSAAKSAKKPIRKATVLSAADFDRRFRASFGTDSVHEFRKRIVRSGSLFVDSVEHLEHKLAAQQELVQIIDLMVAARRPVIVTLDQLPQRCEGLIPALVSRLTGGLTVPVNEPGLVARNVIIRDFSQLHRLNLSENTISLLANRLTVSVPRIAHFFGQLKAAVQMELKSNEDSEAAKTIEPAFINRMFHRSPEDELRFIQAIIQTVANEFKLKANELASDSRKQSIVNARAVAIFLMRKLLGISFLKIGSFFGNRDHSTVMHAYRKIETIMEQGVPTKSITNQPSDPSTKQTVARTVSQSASQFDSLRAKVQELDHRLCNRMASEIKFN